MLVEIDVVTATGVTEDRERALVETRDAAGESSTLSIGRMAAVDFFLAAADVFGRRFAHDERHPQHLLQVDGYEIGRSPDGRVSAVLRMGDVLIPLAFSYAAAAKLAAALAEVAGPVEPRIQDEVTPLLEPGRIVQTR